METLQNIRITINALRNNADRILVEWLKNIQLNGCNKLALLVEIHNEQLQNKIEQQQAIIERQQQNILRLEAICIMYGITTDDLTTWLNNEATINEAEASIKNKMFIVPKKILPFIDNIKLQLEWDKYKQN